MRRIRMITDSNWQVRSFIVAVVFARAIMGTVSAQEPPLRPQAQTERPNNSYAPDLADMMGATQWRHFKLGFAEK